MADIFISYAREDAERVQRIADAFAAGGYDVWWDPEIAPGTQFDDVIDKEIDAAKAVVVVWSENSVASRWVREEANDGLERGVLIAAKIEDVAPPRGFKLVQMADLTDWSGDSDHREWQKVQSRLIQLVGGGEEGTVAQRAEAAFNAGDYKASIPRIRSLSAVVAGVRQAFSNPVLTFVATSFYLMPVLLPAAMAYYFAAKYVSFALGYYLLQVLSLVTVPFPYIVTAAHAVSRKWRMRHSEPMPLWEVLGEVNFRLGRMYKVSFWYLFISVLAGLLILPALWVLVRYGFATSVAATEGTNVSQSMKRSRKLTKGRFWSVLGFHVFALLLVYGLTYGLYFALHTVFMLLGLDPGPMNEILSNSIAPINGGALGRDYLEFELAHTLISWPIVISIYAAILSEGYIRLANEKAMPESPRAQELIRRNISLSTVYAAE